MLSTQRQGSFLFDRVEPPPLNVVRNRNPALNRMPSTRFNWENIE